MADLRLSSSLSIWVLIVDNDCSRTPNSAAGIAEVLHAVGQQAHGLLDGVAVVALEGGAEFQQGVEDAAGFLRVGVAAGKRHVLAAAHGNLLRLNDAAAIVGRIAGSIERGGE